MKRAARRVLNATGVVAVALTLGTVVVYGLTRWPAVTIPIVLVVALLGWWRFYHSLMRRAESAARERRDRIGRRG